MTETSMERALSPTDEINIMAESSSGGEDEGLPNLSPHRSRSVGIAPSA